MRDNEISAANGAFARAKHTWIVEQHDKGRHDSLSARFDLWLLAQGARLDKGYRPHMPFMVDSMDVSPTYDVISFETPEQMTLFLLRHS